jgi:transcriptional regulator with XRE-family HTH domain
VYTERKKTIMDNTFGERLRELRKRRRMNRDELGDILGVSGNAITAYETGKRNPRKEVIDKICEYFDVRYDWLTGASEYKTDREVANYLQCSTSSQEHIEWSVTDERKVRNDEIDLLDACREISPRHRPSLLDFAEFLKKKP